MGQRWKIVLAILFSVAWLALISWHDGYHYEYCERAKDCTKLNLVIFGWLVLENFAHKFESLFIVIFTACLAWFTYQLKAATVALDRSTGKLFESGEKQIALFGAQLDLAERQHGLQREEYFASHRPRASVIRVQVRLVPNAPIEFEFTITNNGEATMQNCRWNAGVLLLNNIGAIHGVYDYSKHTSGVFPHTLSVGTGTLARGAFDGVLSSEDLSRIGNQLAFLHIIGTVHYEDTLGVDRSMGFFRSYDAVRRRFHVVEDSEYEFQD